MTEEQNNEIKVTAQELKATVKEVLAKLDTVIQSIHDLTIATVETQTKMIAVTHEQERMFGQITAIEKRLIQKADKDYNKALDRRLREMEINHASKKLIHSSALLIIGGALTWILSLIFNKGV